MIPTDKQIEDILNSPHYAVFEYIDENGVLWYRTWWLDRHPDGILFLNDFAFPLDPHRIIGLKVFAQELPRNLSRDIRGYVARLRAEEKNG